MHLPMPSPSTQAEWDALTADQLRLLAQDGIDSNDWTAQRALSELANRVPTSLPTSLPADATTLANSAPTEAPADYGGGRGSSTYPAAAGGTATEDRAGRHDPGHGVRGPSAPVAHTHPEWGWWNSYGWRWLSVETLREARTPQAPPR